MEFGILLLKTRKFYGTDLFCKKFNKLPLRIRDLSAWKRLVIEEASSFMLRKFELILSNACLLKSKILFAVNFSIVFIIIDYGHQHLVN